jgi:hypothetical protein
MAKNKTCFTSVSVIDFVNALENKQRKADSLHLLEIIKEISGFEPQMYGPTIIGFGQYHYKYESGHEGDAPILAFSPRKAALVLYVYTGKEEHKHLLEGLGKCKTSKVCIYVNKLSDISIEMLKKLMIVSMEYTMMKYC